MGDVGRGVPGPRSREKGSQELGAGRMVGGGILLELCHPSTRGKIIFLISRYIYPLFKKQNYGPFPLQFKLFSWPQSN